MPGAPVPRGSAASYDEHLCEPEGEKELLWGTRGPAVRTHRVFRTNGRRSRTEACLFEHLEGRWQPVWLPDGTQYSHGRKNRDLPALCRGDAREREYFFTSAFSAQGKRRLAALRNTEIRTLLADLLGLHAIRTFAGNAAETARLLKERWPGCDSSRPAWPNNGIGFGSNSSGSEA